MRPRIWLRLRLTLTQASANIAFMVPGLTWLRRDHIVRRASQAGLVARRHGLLGKEVTECVLVTRGGSSDEQPTGCCASLEGRVSLAAFE